MNNLVKEDLLTNLRIFIEDLKKEEKEDLTILAIALHCIIDTINESGNFPKLKVFCGRKSIMILSGDKLLEHCCTLDCDFAEDEYEIIDFLYLIADYFIHLSIIDNPDEYLPAVTSVMEKICNALMA